MILRALKYTRFENEPREWCIVGKENESNQSFAYFGNFNLVVGKNASGKSRTLDVICKIANLFSGRIVINEAVFSSEKFELIFENEDHSYNYLLSYKDRKVVNEKLSVNDKVIFDRSKGIVKDIRIEKDINIEIDDTHLLIASLINDEPVYEVFVIWGRLFKSYLFSNYSEKNFLAKELVSIDENNQTDENSNVLVYAFKKGSEAFGTEFVNEIKASMAELGYFNMTDIALKQGKDGY